MRTERTASTHPRRNQETDITNINDTPPSLHRNDTQLGEAPFPRPTEAYFKGQLILVRRGDLELLSHEGPTLIHVRSESADNEIQRLGVACGCFMALTLANKQKDFAGVYELHSSCRC